MKRWSPVSKRRRQFAMVGFALVVTIFGWGILDILVTRFDTGEMFPPYSSYRNDPLGTKALFASLDRLPGIEVNRYIDPLRSIADAPAEQTVLLIGVNTEQPKLAPRAFADVVDEVAYKGGRIVLAFAPSEADFLAEELERMGIPQPGSNDDTEDESKKRAAELQEPVVSINDRWGIELKYEPLRFDGDGGLITKDASLASRDDLPETMEWHNGLQFELNDAAWRTVYECRDEVVVAERPLGQGSLVFVGDSFYLTNEGLAVSRQADFIAWLINDSSYVQFDEEHLGMLQHPGTAALIRRYGLESLFAGFILLAILFAWRAGTSIAPRYSDTLPANAGELEMGRDAHSGFANLVQRSTPRDQVVAECVIQWKHSVLPGLGRADAKEIGEALDRAVAENRTAGPLNTYRAVLNQLQERNVLTAYDRKP